MDAHLYSDAVSLGRSRGRTIADRWNTFWFEAVPPDIFALLRILFGLLGGLSLVGLLDLPLFWSCDGLVASQGDWLCRSLAPGRLEWLYPYSILVFSAISFAAMAVGYHARLAVACSFLSVFLIARWNDLPMSAAHQVFRSLLFCLVWADCGRVWSIDAWLKRHDSRPDGHQGVLVWPLRLMQIQVAAVYLVTGLWKVNNVMWRDGSALHYIFENPQFRRSALLASPALDSWTTLATYLTLGWELGFAFLVFHPRTRRVTLALGIVVHLGMWATLELGPFSWVMMAAYVSFLNPEFVRKVGLGQASPRLIVDAAQR